MEVNQEKESVEMCDCCGDKPGAFYCYDCLEAICHAKIKPHKEYFGSRHKVISLKDKLAIDLSVCEKHSKTKLDRVCVLCDSLVCSKCDLYERTCRDGALHDYQPEEKVLEVIKKTFNDQLLKECDKKISLLSGRQETARNGRERIATKCKEMIGIVRMDQEDKVTLEIEKHNEKVKVIQEYFNLKLDQIETYRKSIDKHLGYIESVKKLALDYLHNSSLKALVAKRKEIHSKLNEAGQIAVDSFYLTDNSHLCHGPAGDASKSEIMMVLVPTRVELESKLTLKSLCLSVCFFEDGDLILGCEDGLEHYSHDLKLVETYPQYHHPVWIRYVQDRYYILHTDEQHNECLSICPADLSARAVSDYTYLASLFHLDNFEKLLTPFHPLQEGVILIPYLVYGKVVCYDYIAREILWTCTDLKEPVAIATNSTGLIFVLSATSNIIYVLSQEGEIIMTITEPRLPAVCADFSIHDDRIAIVDPSSNECLVFNFKYD